MRKTMILLPILALSATSLFGQQHDISLQWKISGVLPATGGKLLGFAGPLAGVSNGVFIAGGGANFPGEMPWLGGAKKYYDDLFLYRKDTGDSLILFANARLPFPIAYPACVSTGKGILVAGGENDSGRSDKVFLIRWKDDEKKVVIDHLTDLPEAVSSPSMAVIDGIVYLAGGDGATSTSDRLLAMDLSSASPSWKELPRLPKPASHMVMTALHSEHGGSIFLIGGRKKNPDQRSDFYSTVLRYDVTAKTFSELAALPYPLSAATGVSLHDQSVLVFGGDSGETFHRTEDLINAISKEQDADRKRTLVEQKALLQSGHPGFSKNVLMYSVAENRWKIAGTIPFDSPVTTVAVEWQGEVYIAGGEIRAGVRTPHIISTKLP